MAHFVAGAGNATFGTSLPFSVAEKYALFGLNPAQPAKILLGKRPM
jgi:hypothetical protein